MEVNLPYAVVLWGGKCRRKRGLLIEEIGVELGEGAANHTAMGNGWRKEAFGQWKVCTVAS